MMKQSLLAFGAVLALHATAQAADATSQAANPRSKSTASAQRPPDTWAAHAELGLVMARGNITTNSGDAKLDVAHSLGLWTLSGGLAALYASTSGITTEQDVKAHIQGDRQLGGRMFWFGTGRYDRNLFSGFAYQESVASGLGYSFMKSNATLLSAEIGAGYRRQQPEVLVKSTLGQVLSRTPQAVVNDAVLHTAVKYEHAITASTKVTNTLIVETGSSDTMTADNLSLRVKIDQTFSLAVGVQMTNNTNPPPGNVKHTDTVMTVNLVYENKSSTVSLKSPVPEAVTDLDLP